MTTIPGFPFDNPFEAKLEQLDPVLLPLRAPKRTKGDMKPLGENDVVEVTRDRWGAIRVRVIPAKRRRKKRR